MTSSFASTSLALSRSAPIRNDFADRSGDAGSGNRQGIQKRCAPVFRRRGADEVLAGLEPEQAVFAEIVRPRRLNDIHYALAFLVGVLQRLNAHVG